MERKSLERLCIGSGLILEGIALYMGFVRPTSLINDGMHYEALQSHILGYIPGIGAKICFASAGAMYIQDFWKYLKTKKWKKDQILPGIKDQNL